jgi:hypothetical protein
MLGTPLGPPGAAVAPGPPGAPAPAGNIVGFPRQPIAGSPLAQALAAGPAMGGTRAPPQPQPGAGPAPPGAVAMAPVPAPGPGVPGMIANPAFLQWQMLSQAWHAEKQRREDQFLSACLTLRNDVVNGYRIDIEADSTIAPDEQAEKQARTEFLQSIVPLLQLLVPEAQQNPGAVPLIRALIMFGVRSFPAARSLEEQFDQAFRQLFQSPAPPPEQKGGGNVKSPVEIASEERIAQGDQAVDQQSNQIKAAQVEVAQQKNAIQMFQAWLSAQNELRGQNQEASLRGAELAQQGQEMDDRRRLEQARMAHLVMRDSAGLV